MRGERMAMKKRPYELSVWVEQLNGSNSKIEKKGIIIGAHDMSYLGKATNLVLKRELKGTNTLTFQMPDRYFDSLSGEYVRNEFIDMLYNEAKLKLFYKDRWYEFFIKKIDEKKQHKSYMKTFTCTDAFIDELSRNGYGITYDTDLYNNVEEVGTFSERTLKDSIWQYHPEHNWGDFTEFKEEKLYRIPVSQFGGSINGYKLDFNLTQEQLAQVKEKYGTTIVSNVYNDDIRQVELSDDMCRNIFWDQYVQDAAKDNSLKKDYHTNIDNDGYIYVPYSCLSFCYGSKTEPNFDETLRYDRAATETAIDIDGKLILAPPSVDPRTIIQFYAIPKSAILEIDDAGVIMDKDYSFFMTLADWNRTVTGKHWYMFEDTRLVTAEVVGSVDQAAPSISHTFKYLKKEGEESLLNTDWESRGNKCVIYDSYLSDINNMGIIKGKKFSITNRTEVNISKDIDSYPTVYNTQADDFINEYANEDWDYSAERTTTDGAKYRVCSKLATRQVIPQLARNLVQNGTDMDSIDGWAPMEYLLEDSTITTPSVILKGIVEPGKVDESIYTSALLYEPSKSQLGYKCSITSYKEDALKELELFRRTGKAYPQMSSQEFKDMMDKLNSYLNENSSNAVVYAIGTGMFFPTSFDGQEETVYLQFCDKGDAIYKAFKNGKDLFDARFESDEIAFIEADKQGKIDYTLYPYTFNIDESNADITVSKKEKIERIGNINTGRRMVNFGIIGQEQKIEKTKIYCLGIAALSGSSEGFSIKIGRGTLISEGQYEFADEKEILTFPSTEFNIGQYAGSFDGDNIEINKADIKTQFILFKTNKDIENPYFVLDSTGSVLLLKAYLFEAYTKGMDCFPMTNPHFRYSGRDLFWPPKCSTNITTDSSNLYEYTSSLSEEALREYVIFEDDIMLGSTYGYQRYFIQRLKTKGSEDKASETFDTMGKKSYISSDTDAFVHGELPLDAAKYTEDEYDIQTNYIDLNKCPHYDREVPVDKCDCTHSGGHTCYYQKFGYCPFRFEAEKHPRRVRTLSISKSNRFNIIQEISKVFEIYPQFYIQHKSNGSIVQDDEGEYLKQVFFITEKGVENKIGFRYEKNLKDISRNVVSDQIVTKLYVLDVDSDLSKTGMCSIKTAEDNPSKDSYLIDLSYYIQKGMLDKDEVEQDLYGNTPTEGDLHDMDTIPSGFLYQLGYYNQRYDELSNKIINLQDSSYTELEANLTVNYEGIVTAQEQILKIKKQLTKYKEAYELAKTDYQEQQAYLNYKAKLSEQEAILTQLIYSTFFTNGVCDTTAFDGEPEWASGTPKEDASAVEFFDCIRDVDGSKKQWLDKHSYTKGILGQFNREYLQIQQWKKERASYLKLINQISTAFYKKYEPYLKEGTWSDSNYLTDNAYYFGALDVQAEGAIPKVSYSINVIDLAPLGEEYEDTYEFDVSDVSYVEDIGMFGINPHTGLPNRLKVLISAVSETLDDGSKNSITVQNFTTSFQDLFQQVTASVQSLTYNENIYKRSSNFTSLQAVKTESLQSTLDGNDLTLLDTEENNIQVDNTGTRGSDINNHANKYKLDGQGLFFSNDGGQHWSVGVGPSGINADYIKVGTLDAGKIRIVDGNYVYFSWSKDGIVAYRDPQGINTTKDNIDDSAIFNKYGLSIVSNGAIKLRAGYSFAGNEGKITTENTMGDEIGFYLYNNNGVKIFSTSTGESRQSAMLTLTGEMFVSNSLEVQRDIGRTYTGKLYTNFGSKEILLFPTPTNITVYEVKTDEIEPAIKYCEIPDTDKTPTQAIVSTIFIENDELNQITIKRNGSSITYKKQGIEKTEINKLCSNSGGKANIYNYNVDAKFTVSISDEAAQLTTILMRKKKLGTDDQYQYFIMNSNTTEYFTSENIILYVGADESATITAQSYGSYDKELYEMKKDGSCEKRTQTRYYSINGDVYITQGSDQEHKSVNSDVGLYLNNKRLSGAQQANEKERLFVICSEDADSNSVANIFSVLKNGSAYFGGTIQGVDGNTTATDLSDLIEINNAKMKIEDGSLYIEFSEIRSPSTGQSLSDYISQEISNSTSPIYTAIADAVNDLNRQLSTQIGQIEGFKNHWHWLQGGNITLDQHSSSAVTGSEIKDRLECYVRVQSSADNSNYRFTNIKLKDLIEVGDAR